MDELPGLESLAVVAVVAALAPVLAALIPGRLVPQIVLLIIGGVVVGPEVLGWADSESLELLANVGLGSLWFAGAAQRLKLSTIGRLQYLAPSGQLALGVLIYGEAFGWIDGVAFALIWTALAIYTFSALRPASPVPKPVSAE